MEIGHPLSHKKKYKYPSFRDRLMKPWRALWLFKMQQRKQITFNYAQKDEEMKIITQSVINIKPRSIASIKSDIDFKGVFVPKARKPFWLNECCSVRICSWSCRNPRKAKAQIRHWKRHLEIKRSNFWSVEKRWRNNRRIFLAQRKIRLLLYSELHSTK